MPTSTDGEFISVIRSEERLRADIVRVPVQRAVLRKVIVSEERTMTVTVRREEFHVDYETLDAADESIASPTRSPVPTPPIEIVLHEERIEIIRTVVPVERIRVDVRPVVEQRAVTGDVRMEQLDIDDVDHAETANPSGRHRR